MELINKLENCIGEGTSLLSLWLPANTNYQLVISKLEHEFKTADNIKDRGCRHSIKKALTMTINELKLINTINLRTGIAIFSGQYLWCYFRYNWN